MAFLSTPHITARPIRRPRRGIVATALAWAALARQRRRLAQLDDAALDDMGITRADAQHEAARLPWDAPARWRG